jgi:hypothetical protein
MKNNIVDLRDLGKEFNDLKELQDDCLQPGGEPFSEEDQERLDALQKLANDLRVDDLENYDEPTMIVDSYFENYAREVAEEFGCIDTKGNCMTDQWPYNCIDWEKASEELQQYYISVEFDGETYWIKSR